MRVGPVGIVNGTFGNRPHCIYRGYLPAGLQGQREGQPLRHPSARRARARRRDPRRQHGRAGRDRRRRRPARRVSPTFARARSAERFQRAVAVAVCGYSIETPRLLLHSTSKRFPNGLGNNEDQVGRYVMVQGASQTAGRFPEEQRMYKAPPPEVSSEQFYETDEARGFARGFSIQTVSPAADRLGRARARRRPLGPGAARVHARLQPLGDDRRAQRAATPAREPRHARRGDGRTTGCRSRVSTTAACENDKRQHGLLEE